MNKQTHDQPQRSEPNRTLDAISSISSDYCRVCGVRLLKMRPWQVFCSTSCRMRGHRARQLDSRQALEALAAIAAIIDRVRGSVGRV